MTTLRDINLRWSQDRAAPEWFWKRGPLEYVFYKELRALKINTPGFSKINIYCEPQPSAYAGHFFDGVTDVGVEAKWGQPERMSSSELNQLFLAHMVRGVKVVLAWYDLQTSGIDDAAHRAVHSAESLCIPIGKQAKSPATGVVARLQVRPLPDLSACAIVLVVMRGRKVICEKTVCTTFPIPEIGIDCYDSLEWENERTVIAKFRTGGAGGKNVFGRVNFDHSGMSGVHRIDQSQPLPPHFLAEPTFTIDVSDLKMD